VVFPIYTTKVEVEKARKAKGVPPRDALGLMDLATGKVTRIEGAGSFQVPEEGPAILVYHIGARITPKGTATKGTGRKGGPRAKTDAPAPARANPTPLVVRHLATGKERT